jgi:hypothetical protein
LTGGITGNPIIQGALSGAAYSTVSDLFHGKLSLPSLLSNAAMGAALGPLASRLTPKVPGRFPEIWKKWRDLQHYLPRTMPAKTQQILRGAGLGGLLGLLGDVYGVDLPNLIGDLFGRSCK